MVSRRIDFLDLELTLSGPSWVFYPFFLGKVSSHKILKSYDLHSSKIFQVLSLLFCVSLHFQ